MNIAKNLLAVLGAIFMVLLLIALPKIYAFKSAFNEFDPKAMETYQGIMNQLIETGDGAEATVWKYKVVEGQTAEDIELSLKTVATEHNIRSVGELPLYQQVSSMKGKPYRFVKIYMFCNPLTAANMLDYNDAFSAYLPCRITVVQDKTGAFWLYTMNMDLMIYGGKPLPEALKKEAVHVKEVIQDIMKRTAEGDF